MTKSRNLMTKKGVPLQFLYESLENISHDGSCVVWRYGVGSHGYGVLTAVGRNFTAPALALTIFKGPRPPGTEAAHGPCGNKLCFHPDHLSWESRSVNQGDHRLRDGTDNRGEKHGQAKLTEIQARAIKFEHSDLNNAEVSRLYNTSRENARDIRNNKRWAWLTER